MPLMHPLFRDAVAWARSAVIAAGKFVATGKFRSSFEALNVVNSHGEREKARLYPDQKKQLSRPWFNYRRNVVNPFQSIRRGSFQSIQINAVWTRIKRAQSFSFLIFALSYSSIAASNRIRR